MNSIFTWPHKYFCRYWQYRLISVHDVNVIYQIMKNRVHFSHFTKLNLFIPFRLGLCVWRMANMHSHNIKTYFVKNGKKKKVIYDCTWSQVSIYSWKKKKKEKIKNKNIERNMCCMYEQFRYFFFFFWSTQRNEHKTFIANWSCLLLACIA